MVRERFTQLLIGPCVRERRGDNEARNPDVIDDARAPPRGDARVAEGEARELLPLGPQNLALTPA